MTPQELKQYIVDAHLTIKEIALKMGMKPATLRGKISENNSFIPGEIEKVQEIAKALKEEKDKQDKIVR